LDVATINADQLRMRVVRSGTQLRSTATMDPPEMLILMEMIFHHTL